MSEFIDLILHVDRYLADVVDNYGAWVYAILFAIIYAETGLVVTPFLPGDSLLFAAGALAASGVVDGWLVFGLVVAAAVAGNTVNYAIGRSLGQRLIDRASKDPRLGRWLNLEYVERAHKFFGTHGGRAVILARFMPIVRTFVPFVAGIATMPYRPYMIYNLIGGVAWAGLCIGAGYLFGNVPVVKNNFSLVAIAIVLISLLPAVIAWARARSTAPSR